MIEILSSNDLQFSSVNPAAKERREFRRESTSLEDPENVHKNAMGSCEFKAMCVEILLVAYSKQIVTGNF